MDFLAREVISITDVHIPDAQLVSYNYSASPSEEIYTHNFIFKSDTVTRPTLQDLVERLRRLDVDADKRVEFLQFDTRFMIIIVITC